MKNKFAITNNMISTLGGFCLVLLSLVILLAANTPFYFLSDLITHSFGFVGFWLLLPFIAIVGLYLIFKKKLIELKLGVQLWGCLILIITFLILSSHWASVNEVVDGVKLVGKYQTTYEGAPKYLTFSTSLSVFDNIASSYSAKVGPTPKLGGGRVGFILAGALNSAITPIGLNVLCWIFFVSSIIMIFHRQFLKLINALKTKRTVHKNHIYCKRKWN